MLNYLCSSSIIVEFMIDTGELLRQLGYEYYELSEEKVAPDRVNLTFSDIIPELKNKGIEIASSQLFEHQLKSYNALMVKT